MATQYKPNPTRAEMREELKNEKAAPPQGKTKPTEIFKEGMKPPKDDEGPVKKMARGGHVKTKRYAAGGEADDEAKSNIVTKFGKAPGGEDTFERDREVKRGESEASPSSFKEAFAAARSAGNKTFEHNGKKYTTEVASAKKPTPRPEPKEAVKETVSEHLSEEFKKRPAGTGMKESARQARVDRIRRNVGSNLENFGMKKGGSVSASSRGDGIAQRGKTKGKIC
jgi:hypothetical protein